jgi:hypothetical protein
MSTAEALALLSAVRDALSTPDGARIAREIRVLVARADECEVDGSGYAARVVARAYARAERRPSRPRGSAPRGPIDGGRR